jgi:Tfp pilus assembly PilM family ATPase
LRPQDNEVLEQIQRDVKRTHAEHPFFEGKAAAPVAHRAALTRALQVFAKLNPGLLYVQVCP